MVKALELVSSLSIIRKIPIGWKLKLQYLISKKPSYPLLSKNDLKVIVTLAADYGNLGDIAITYAQTKFLKEHFPDRQIITVHVKDTYMLNILKKSIGPDDIITIIGGGNMGDVYESYEGRRRYIIHLFPNNKIISFPQSIDFRTKKSLNKSVKIYSKHQNLHIFARETKSFELMRTSFINNYLYLVPDIVFYLNKVMPTFHRDGIILCLRNDIERSISKNQWASLVTSIEGKYQNIQYYDTFIGDFQKGKEDVELDNIWSAFKKAKVVVTDRLHGMIFCAITNTPCIVLPNSNHKISSTYYKWLDHLKFIIYIEHFDEKQIVEHIDSIYHNDPENGKFSLNLTSKFRTLSKALKNEET